MSNDSPEVTAARIDAERARARLMDTAQDLQTKLNPKLLAQNAWDDAKVKGADLADDAVYAVRRRPRAAAGIAAAAVVYLARKPLKTLACKIVRGRRSSNEDEYRSGPSEFSERDYRITETL